MNETAFWKNRTVLVTGGAGFIGSHLVRRFLSLGVRRVIVVDSLEYGTKENLPDDERVTLIVHTVGTDPISLLAGPLTECEYVFHLAAQKHNQSLANPRAIYDTNIIGTADLFELAGKSGVKKIVFSSSLYAYGKTTLPPMREDDCPKPHTLYGISKLAGEHILAYYAKKSAYAHVIVRYFFVYGPRQFPGTGYKSVIVKNFERLARGESPMVFGDGKQSLDYVYVDDAVDATIKAAEAPITGEVFNVGSGTAVPVIDLVTLMSKIASPPSGGKMEYGPADETHGTARVSDPSKASHALQWRPLVSLEDGLRRTFEWVKQNHT